LCRSTLLDMTSGDRYAERIAMRPNVACRGSRRFSQSPRPAAIASSGSSGKFDKPSIAAISLNSSYSEIAPHASGADEKLPTRRGSGLKISKMVAGRPILEVTGRREFSSRVARDSTLIERQPPVRLPVGCITRSRLPTRANPNEPEAHRRQAAKLARHHHAPPWQISGLRRSA
jgi:hypothetical protein